MTDVEIRAHEISHDEDKPLLILGPSLGTSAATLYGEIAPLLTPHFRVVAWDLPGHGETPVSGGSFTMAELAAGVRAMVDGLAGTDEPFFYAGDSVGGAVGLQLLLDEPQRVLGAALMCTGAQIGSPQSWAERAQLTRQEGTSALVDSSAQRWFGGDFQQRQPETAAALLGALAAADREGYARVCEALGGFDVRDRLSEIFVPVLTIAGADDVATPPASLEVIARGVRDGRSEVLDGVGHLAPVEAPQRVAKLLVAHFLNAPGVDVAAAERTLGEVYDSGMAVRREVLGDAHVDRANAATTDFTRDFQTMITRYAWGGIWDRDGLDRRTRSIITLTALVALGHHEELAMHVRAARTNGLTDDEIKEVLLQCAIYCGVPAANSAFKIAQRVLNELDGGE